MPLERIKDEKDWHREARRLVDSAYSGWSEVYEAAEEDAEMLDGTGTLQWSEEAVNARNETDRPVLTANGLDRFVDRVTGGLRENPVSIQIRPVDDNSDPLAAETYEGVIRAILYTSSAQTAFQVALDAAAGFSVGYFRLRTDYEGPDTFDQCAIVEPIYDPWAVRIDPKSVKPDRSDMDYAVVAQRIPVAEFEARYGEDELPTDVSEIGDGWQQWYELGKNGEQIEAVTIAEFWWREYGKERVLLQLEDGSTVYEDEAETDTIKEDGEKFKAVLGGQVETAAGVADIWLRVVRERKVREVKCKSRVMSGTGWLEDESEWHTDRIPVYLVRGKERIYNGTRTIKSVIRNNLDTQRLKNVVLSSAAEQLMAAPKAPWVADMRAIEEYLDEWENANDPSIQVLRYKGSPNLPNGGMPQRTPPITPPTAQFAMLAQLEELQKQGTSTYDAALGAQSREESGRAIRARQQESDTANAVFTGNLISCIEELGKDLLDVIPAIYDTPRVVRILGKDKEETELVGINGARAPGQEESINLNAGKYDLVVTTGPALPTRRMEAQESILAAMQRMPPDAAMLVFAKAAKYFDWPGGDDIREALEQAGGQAMSPEVAQQVQQIAQQTTVEILQQLMGGQQQPQMDPGMMGVPVA